MTPAQQFTAMVLGGFLCLAACEPHESVTTIMSADVREPLPPPPAQFNLGTDCTPPGVYRAPAAGTRFTYTRTPGHRSERVIVSADGGIVGFAYRDLSRPGQQPLPTRHAVMGMLVTYPDPAARRQVVYDRDPVAAVAVLAPGQTLEIPTVETSTLGGRTRRLRYPTTVTYRACGSLSVGGLRMPVRVYDVVSARRVMDRRGRDDIRQGRVTYYLSDADGFPLAYQDAITSVAVGVERTADEDGQAAPATSMTRRTS